MMNSKEHFLALDGLRGVAALAVLVLHRGRWFYEPGGFLGHGYLAVDFFFLLSGFVIAFAYDGRIRDGLGVWAFMRLRLIRLYPLIFLGMLLGALWPLIRLMAGMKGAPAPDALAIDLLRGLLLIPDNYAPGPGDSIFPLNGPTWSLFFELAANLAFVLIGPRLTTRVLAVIVALSAVALTVTAFQGGVDVGQRPSTLWGGFPRVGVGFFGGVLLYRVIAAARARGWSAPVLPAPFLVTALCLVAILSVPRRYGPEFDLLALFVLFPVLVTLAAAPGTSGGYGARLCRLAGDLSYPVYVLHYPLYVLIGGLGFQMAGIVLSVPLRGIVSATIVIVIAWLVLKLYDEPLRRRLMQAVKRPATPATVEGARNGRSEEIHLRIAQGGTAHAYRGQPRAGTDVRPGGAKRHQPALRQR
jgi:peptidoglycan/LPS O-acetylase OafA/YrhL